MGRLEEYEVMKLLGKGSFGSVYCVRRLNDRSLHVMKKISIHNMPQKERIATEQECKVLQRLRHPGIVCYEDSFIHKNRQLCIVMAFCEGGDLSTVIEKRRMRSFPEHEVINWFLQISLALQYMHDEHILHRDLKTQNIFLTKQGIIKLGDFGIAKVLEGTLEMAKTVIGTPYYMSPELFRNQPYSYKSDIWSLGCVLYEIVGLKHAFEARDMNSLVQKILRGNYAPIPSAASKDVRALIKDMLALSPASRPSVNQVLALPFIRKQMGSYIQNQLGDDNAANLIHEQNDPRMLQFFHMEQDHLEQQARKLGIDVKKRNTADAVPLPSRAAKEVLPSKPNNSSLPSAQEAEKERVSGELREKERQKRAKEFLERELRAKERAEQALKQLQKEKMERLKALQEQRNLRQKRMSNVHPRGEAGLMNDWQKRLQQAQLQHEQRRREMGMVPGDHRPKPPPKSKLDDKDKAARQRSVLEQRNVEARQKDKEDERGQRDPAAGDKENVKNILQRQHQEREAKRKGDKKDNEADLLKQREESEEKKALEREKQRQAEEERRRIEEEKKAAAEAAAAQKRAENEKLRAEMNRDMQLMESKLKELKAKKEAEEARKKARAAALADPNKAAAAAHASNAVMQQAAGAGLAARAAAPAADGWAVGAQQAPKAKPAAAAPARVDAPTRDVIAGGPGHSSQPPHLLPPPSRRTPPDAQGIRASIDNAQGYHKMMRPSAPNVDATRQSEPFFSPPLYAPPSEPPPHRLQALKSPMAAAGAGPTYYGGEDIFGEGGLGGDLISRQKELDRQQARSLIQQDTDRGMQELHMSIHRINKAVNSSAASRPMMLPAEVGAKITERDRQLRDRQAKEAQMRRMHQGRQGALRGFSDVAHDGALYSPMRGAGGGDGGWVAGDESPIEDEVDDKAYRGRRVLSPPQEVDEQLADFEAQEANLENELAHRTLKIQMLKTTLRQAA